MAQTTSSRDAAKKALRRAKKKETTIASISWPTELRIQGIYENATSTRNVIDTLFTYGLAKACGIEEIGIPYSIEKTNARVTQRVLSTS